jgi:hypothetical protein
MNLTTISLAALRMFSSMEAMGFSGSLGWHAADALTERARPVKLKAAGAGIGLGRQGVALF